MAPAPRAKAPRVAAIDVGTNTVLLLIATGDANHPVARVERATITRLGEGVDGTGRLAGPAMDRTIACLEGYARIIADEGVSDLDVVCTSAARDAQNGAEFIARAESVLGKRPRIIGGDEEACLTYEGALSGLAVDGAVTIFDIGGGSTEIIHGTAGDASLLHSAVSLDIGSVRLTERHVRTDPPSTAELDAIRRDVSAALAPLSSESASTLVGVAGTITTLAAIEQSLDQYDSSCVHGSRLRRATVSELVRRLAALPLEERRAVSGLPAARADVIVAGALIAEGVLAWARADELVVSDRGVRWGVAKALLGRAGQ
jgi:exopolyphosphatase/guanosine-5'-triphosphate,3'-diphosphate pyrophosphatase